MTTMAEYESRIDPKVWSHADWLWELGDEKILDTNTRKRLQAIAVLLKYRPDINAPEDFRFEIGKTYMSLGGELVTIKGRTDAKGCECVYCEKGIHRYNRSNFCGDLGRTTGIKGDCPTNLIPIEVQIPEPINLRDMMRPKFFRRPGIDRLGTACIIDGTNFVPGAVNIHALDGKTVLISYMSHRVGGTGRFWISADKLTNWRYVND